jgi:hypothetical protein
MFGLELTDDIHLHFHFLFFDSQSARLAAQFKSLGIDRLAMSLPTGSTGAISPSSLTGTDHFAGFGRAIHHPGLFVTTRREFCRLAPHPCRGDHACGDPCHPDSLAVNAFSP